MTDDPFEELAETELYVEMDSALDVAEALHEPITHVQVSLPNVNNIAAYDVADGSTLVALRLSPIAAERLRLAWEGHQQGDSPSTAAVVRLCEQIVQSLAGPRNEASEADPTRQ